MQIEHSSQFVKARQQCRVVVVVVVIVEMNIMYKCKKQRL